MNNIHLLTIRYAVVLVTDLVTANLVAKPLDANIHTPEGHHLLTVIPRDEHAIVNILMAAPKEERANSFYHFLEHRDWDTKRPAGFFHEGLPQAIRRSREKNWTFSTIIPSNLALLGLCDPNRIDQEGLLFPWADVSIIQVRNNLADTVLSSLIRHAEGKYDFEPVVYPEMDRYLTEELNELGIFAFIERSRERLRKIGFEGVVQSLGEHISRESLAELTDRVQAQLPEGYSDANLMAAFDAELRKRRSKNEFE